MAGKYLLASMLLLFFTEPTALCQSYSFREYTVSDGLPQSQSSVISQDRRGFVWIGTRNGLSRFDGVEFKNFFRKDGLASNEIGQIIEDARGNIWILTVYGLSEFTGNGFKYYSHGDDLFNWRFSNATCVDDINGFFLINYNPKGISYRLFCFKGGIYSDYAKNFPALDTIDFSNICYDNSRSELFFLDMDGNAYAWKDEKLRRLSEDHYDDLKFDKGRMFFFMKGKRFDYSDGQILNTVSFRRNDSSVYNLCVSDGSDFYPSGTGSELRAPFNTYSNSLIDDEGISWFATEKNLYRLISKDFVTFSEEDGLGKNIWTIAEDKNGHMWFGSLFGDLQEYDGRKFTLRNEYKKLFTNRVAFFKGTRKMSNGETWFSTNQGVLVWDGISFSRIDGINENTQVCYIYEDPDNKSVLIGTDIGLYYLKNNVVKVFHEFQPSGFGVIEGVIKDLEGNYWLSGNQGLFVLKGSQITKIRDKVLPPDYTFELDIDSRGSIWITSEEGLYCYSALTNTFRHGLPEKINNTANSLMMIDSTHLLIGRVADICIIDLKKFYGNHPVYYRIYDKTDGYNGGDCLDNGIIKDKDGKIWILTSDNVVKIDPPHIKFNNVPPRLYITGFEYQDDSLKWVHASDTGCYTAKPGEVTLRNYQNSIKIKFTGISTPNPEKVLYRHYVKGYEDNWSLPASDRYVIYEQLPPGKYSFCLTATNADGVETPDPLIFNFSIVPGFSQTLLFKIIVTLVAVFITVLITWYSIKLLQKKRAENERLKSEISHLQVNLVIRPLDPHFIFNVLSSVGSLVMKGEKETAYEFILKLSHLLRIVLKSDSKVVKSLADEMDFVKKYLELQKLRFKERLTYSIDIEGEIDMQRKIPAMTILTFVENSIKHGIENKKEGGHVSITLGKTNAGLEIFIKDDGIGLSNAQKIETAGNGKGLKIVNGIFNIFNVINSAKVDITLTDLNETNSKSTGTQARIFIPDGYSFEF